MTFSRPIEEGREWSICFRRPQSSVGGKVFVTLGCWRSMFCGSSGHTSRRWGTVASVGVPESHVSWSESSICAKSVHCCRDFPRQVLKELWQHGAVFELWAAHTDGPPHLELCVQERSSVGGQASIFSLGQSLQAIRLLIKFNA